MSLCVCCSLSQPSSCWAKALSYAAASMIREVAHPSLDRTSAKDQLMDIFPYLWLVIHLVNSLSVP